MVDARKEDIIQTVLNNTVPTIEGGQNQSFSVKIGEKASFVIRTYDENGDNITAELERNDRGLFDLSTESSGLYYLLFAGTQLDGTWKAHVSISDGKDFIEDGKSSILFTASVYVATPPCVNDRSYRYNNVQKKSCVWVGEKESRRQKLCREKNQVRLACRMTCGICCKDDQGYTFDIGNGVVKTCKWISQEDSRSSTYCQRKKVSSNCPITCATCQKKFTCTEDMTYRVEKGDNKWSCAQIGRKEDRRLQSCTYPVVRRNCPTMCGICCENNQDFVFMTDSQQSKDCEWIKAKSSRINKYCPQPEIRSNCPAKSTCNSCKQYVQVD